MEGSLSSFLLTNKLPVRLELELHLENTLSNRNSDVSPATTNYMSHKHFEKKY